jgi:hypothetical protein
MEWDKLDGFTRAYVEAALWSSNDESDDNGGEPTDKNYGIEDVEPSAIAEMAEDCREFQFDNSHLLAKAGDDEQNGHDFWLTRNRHGAGFWDRGYGRVGDILTDRAHEWGESHPYVGDDGKVYID